MEERSATPRREPHRGLVDRRGFVRTLALLSGAAVVGPRLGGAPATAAAQEPERGGTYHVLTNEQFGSLDAARAFNYIDWWISYTMLYNRLYQYDPAGVLQPDLAASLPEISEDGLTYTIKLKPGVTFHNGREMTAEDVKFSLDRQLWPEVEALGGSYLDNILGYDELSALQGTPGAAVDPTRTLSGVTVLDPLTIEIALKQPQSILPGVLGIGVLGIVPKQETLDAGPDWGTTTVIGTGPFKLVEWVTGERLQLERFEDYFHPGKPYLDAVEVELNVQPESVVLRWEAGEAEMIIGAPAAELGRIRSDPELSKLIREGPSTISYRLQFSDKAPLYQDIRVRQAVAMAIDKENLARLSQNGVAVDGFLVPGIAQEDPGFETAYPYDPERARALLAEAGVAEGTKTIFWSGGTGRQGGESIQADLQAIGFDVELLVLEGSSLDVFLPRIESGEIPLTGWGFGYDYPDGSEFLIIALKCDTTAGQAFWCDPRIDEMGRQIDALALDDPQRTELLREVQRIAV